ncbi:MAG: hypothetical protein ACRDP6_37890, partial [Actinoallomurus sp.]
AWWMPAFLARIIPVVDIEGTSLSDQPAGGVAEAAAIEDGATPEIVSAAARPAGQDVVRASDAGKSEAAETPARKSEDGASRTPETTREKAPASLGDATSSPDEPR